MAIQIDVLCVDESYPDLSRTDVYLKNEVLIGRSEANDIVLDHPGISSGHVKIRIEDTEGGHHFYLTDLKSTNGTYIGNDLAPPLQEVPVGQRDRVMIAGYILRMKYVPDSSVNGNGHSAKEESLDTDANFGLKPIVKPKGTSSYNLTEAVEAAQSYETLKEDQPMEQGNRFPESSAAARIAVQDSDVELDFVATELFSIRGRLAHNSNPLAGVQVMDEKLGSKTTDENGEFCYENILDGTSYSLEFKKEGYSFPDPILVGTVDGNDAELSAVARRFASIRGQVIHRGKPMEGVVVDGGPLGKVTTDSSGSYQFSNILEGEEHTLTAMKDGFVFGSIRKTSS